MITLNPLTSATDPYNPEQRHKNAFDKLKVLLSTSPVYFKKILFTDASDKVELWEKNRINITVEEQYDLHSSKNHFRASSDKYSYYNFHNFSSMRLLTRHNISRFIYFHLLNFIQILI